MNKVLTIAGSDSSGGAGIQADLKTMTVLGVYGMSVITALTAQNTMGVTGVLESTPEFVGQQMEAVFTDIEPQAVKIGMVSNSEIIKVIAEKLTEYKAENIVVDPVMIATSGSNLMESAAVTTLIKELFPLATVVTPNKFEAETLSGISIESEEDMEKAASIILKYGPKSVLIKGGHFGQDARDYLKTEETAVWLTEERINNPNTHGTGCTLSSAIATYLAKGEDLISAVKSAKQYLTGAIADGMDLGHGRGPLNHMYKIMD
ncbi:MAG: bifunctional hydroxymethylpyrimidine kinase/phosphomethylpyrimidine kinase [Clostridiaceae bacterium]